ncbi:negative elongation factor C D-like, partial [Paramuricea clavata]
MVHLVSRGYVVAVVSYIRKCTDTQKVDNSLIRHFVTEVLDIIAPPYSDEFVDIFQPVVQNEEITGSLRNAEKNDDVSIFI